MEHGFSKGRLTAARATAGFFVDAGFNFNTSDTSSLMIFLRIKSDFTYAYKDDDVVSNAKNRSFQLTAAYGFGLE